ncbi:uncharacterized protein LOC109862504 [Pseudomyrmex gracilis]|uniref:uncharacterized protein LOC109862504 n=1 Tax=Pseudomyrmex gracilis TaxID=219809 RepID=UPI0009950549|nr:uncharacterized protein LOC109862504 [Pseudomyrmex gracilis]
MAKDVEDTTDLGQNNRMPRTSIYRPPNCGLLGEFQDIFLDLQTGYRHSVIFGDFNADMSVVSYDSNQLSQFIESSGLYLVPYQKTHHLKNSNSFLDLCIVDDFEKVAGNFKIDEFYLNLQAKEWEQLKISDSIDKKIDMLNDYILQCLNKHAPVQRRTFKNFPAPWLTGDIKAAMRNRDRVRRRWRRTGNNDDDAAFRRLRNQVQDQVRAAKARYYLRIFDSAQNPNTVWSHLKHLGRFYWKYISPQAIQKTVSRIKTNATGCDEISLKMFYLTMSYIMPVMEHIFDFSLSHGIFPNIWKKAVVCPIPKINTPTASQHYRPIVILPVMSKILEQIVCDQIQAFLEENDLFDPYQLAYRKGHSTQTGIIRVLDDMRLAADKRMITVSVLFDLSKAFDRVHHPTLLRKLEDKKFSTLALRWIASYLEGRQQAIITGSSRYINAIDFATLPDIVVDDVVVQYSSAVKYLGITIASTLSWDKHVNNTTNKSRRTLYQLKLCKNLMPQTLKQCTWTIVVVR